MCNRVRVMGQAGSPAEEFERKPKYTFSSVCCTHYQMSSCTNDISFENNQNNKATKFFLGTIKI